MTTYGPAADRAARADVALGAAVAGPPLGLRPVLRSTSAVYLADATGPRACLVESAGGVVVPGAIVLPAGIGWEWLLCDHLGGAAPVVLGDGALRCGRRRVEVRPGLDLRVPTTPRDPDRVRRAVTRLDGALATSPAPADLPWPTARLDGAATLGALRAAAATLVGAGPGMTPSGDDFLAAALLVHVTAGTPGAAEVGAGIVAHAARRTTAAAVLQYQGVLRGAASPQVRAALRAVLGPTDPTRELAALLALGHTSGHDLGHGLRSGLAALIPAPPVGATYARLRPAERTPA